MLAFLAGIASSALAAQEIQHEWSYDQATGPDHWGDLSPAYSACKTGREQSPIDIQNPKREKLPPIQVAYKNTPLKIIDTGHTIQVNYSPGSFIMVGGTRYELRQFHFHHPAEERVQGKSFPMVAHLVHADGDGKLTVLAIPLERGAANKTIQTVWTHLPKIKGVQQEISETQISAADLLPHNLKYFRYLGSLTTPPCTEGVTWFVLKSPGTISPEEIDTFGRIYANNARPIQRIGERAVKSSR